MLIELRTLAHKKQRYDTLGDWFERDGFLQIRASILDNPDYEFLILLHELVEAWLCRKRGISEADVDRFDVNYVGDGEPGDDVTAPYHDEHRFATLIEKLMAAELGIDWLVYERDLDSKTMKWDRPAE